MTPPRPGRACGAARPGCMRNVPVRVTSSTTDHCSSVMSTRSAVPPRPALLTSTSTPPSRRDGRREQRRPPRPRRSRCRARVSGRVPVSSARPVGGLAQPALVEVADEHLRPLLQGPAGHGRADAGAGGGGDDHRAVGQQAVAGHVGGRGAQVGIGRLVSGSGLAGQAEGPLADDVALDLVGPAVDGVGPGEEEQALGVGQLVARLRGRRAPDPGARRPRAASTASSPRARCQRAQ